MIIESIVSDLCLVSAFLAKRDVPALDVDTLRYPEDLLVLMGSSLLITTVNHNPRIIAE